MHTEIQKIAYVETSEIDDLSLKVEFANSLLEQDNKVAWGGK